LIASVRGRIEARDGTGVIVEVGGIGLRVDTPTSTLARIGAPGETATLYTHLHVREDELRLFGFASTDDRDFFELLITVSGVGPRNGLAMLSALSTDQMREAIASENVTLLTAVPGIGKRLASRIVLDLKEKVGPRGIRTGADFVATGSGDTEVIEALTQVFGYSAQQAAQAVAALGPDAPTELEERIRAALRSFSGR
jgi:Holliday junction DNA helicase RuvA